MNGCREWSLSEYQARSAAGRPGSAVRAVPGFARNRRQRPRASRGFTLLELMIVLVVAGLIMTIAPPLFSRALPGTQLKGTAREIAAGLRYAHGQAITKQQQATFTLDTESDRFQVTGRSKTYSLPDTLDYSMTTAESERIDTYVASIRFYPDGSSTGGRVSLAYGERRYHVDVDWLTGRVSIIDE